MIFRKICIFIILFSTGPALWGQSISQGDSLMKACRFEEALRVFSSISRAGMTREADDSLERKIGQAEHALSLSEFCAEPHVVARKRFSREDFFQYYPLQNKAWRKSPNQLDSEGSFPLYFPKGSKVIYYSAPDKAGTRSLYMTRDLDSLWQAPRLLGEAFLSTGSEIFPMLSADGKTLYFASDGLMGMGGYDIYSSTWDKETKQWSAPVNMGFPFSSPADDFLMAESDDGDYTLFASNRECTPDSVYVYVIDSAVKKERKSIRRADDLLKLLSLAPEEDPSRFDNDEAMEGFVPGNATTQRYMRKMEESRALMDSISRHMSNPADTLLPTLRARLAKVSSELREVEMSFLMSGAVATQEDREVVGAELGYTFARDDWGSDFSLNLAPSSVAPSYRIAPVGRFAQDNTLPPGDVFQILLFDSPTHATLEDIKGLTPVYERLGSNLRYSYLIGLFPTYHAALEELNVIRLMGFPSARIVAWRDGRPIAL